MATFFMGVLLHAGARGSAVRALCQPRPPSHAAPPDEDDPDDTASFLGRLRQLDVTTATALCCGSVALFVASVPSVSFLTKPLSALGLLLGLLGVLLNARRHKGLNLTLAGAGSALCLFVVLFVGVWPFPGDPGPLPAAMAIAF